MSQKNEVSDIDIAFRMVRIGTMSMKGHVARNLLAILEIWLFKAKHTKAGSDSEVATCGLCTFVRRSGISGNHEHALLRELLNRDYDTPIYPFNKSADDFFEEENKHQNLERFAWVVKTIEELRNYLAESCNVSKK